MHGKLIRGEYGILVTAVFMLISKGWLNASTTINRALKLFLRPDKIDGMLVGVVLRTLTQ